MSPALNKSSNVHREPLKKTGAISHLKSFEITPTIGTQFVDAQITDILRAENADEQLRDLAITISERGVVFFKNQDMQTDHQKVLAQKLGELTGKPSTSKLHTHPANNLARGLAKIDDDRDDQISVISSGLNRKVQLDQFNAARGKTFASVGWHSDITFERIPSDYACLKIHTLPPSGGDSLWASGCEMYDRISPSMRSYFDTLTATFIYINSLRNEDSELFTTERGAPENIGNDFVAVHPAIRTNPVTGWKSVYAVGHHMGHINEVSQVESDMIVKYFHQLIVENHDLQVRFKWEKNDVAIWDNRSTYHSATNDIEGRRIGHRAVGLGEKPYFDPQSKSRREALGIDPSA